MVRYLFRNNYAGIILLLNLRSICDRKQKTPDGADIDQ